MEKGKKTETNGMPSFADHSHFDKLNQMVAFDLRNGSLQFFHFKFEIFASSKSFHRISGVFTTNNSFRQRRMNFTQKGISAKVRILSVQAHHRVAEHFGSFSEASIRGKDHVASYRLGAHSDLIQSSASFNVTAAPK